ncbi:hypothetical protein BDY19DRAFT_130210 [Irpex rosettiformis]|uniref:Uncharacterized protein n=1 Tax=Irpex rosettiformis TaxID=378272 RepID=A0ACB8U5G5_9APHY|nr:hypothetical protein BDY19DRAFT_130210 [Irpex rosettiformis]
MSRRETRSSARTKAAPPDSDDDQPIVSTSKAVNGRAAAEDPVSALEAHVSKVVQSARSLRQEYTKLQKKHEELQAELTDAKEQLEAEEQPKRGSKGAKKGPSVAQLQKVVAELKGRVRKLEKVRARDRRKIAKLETKEIKRDAEELQDQTEFEIGDNVHVMRKLLRKFRDLMLANSLDNSEECSICMSTMEIGKATGLPCQHVFCTSCIQGYISARNKPNRGYASDDEDSTSIPCPQCREPASLEDMEVVEYTSATQWDALLEVANKSAKLDRRRGGMDTSEEEEEEERVNGFIDDEDNEDGSSSMVDTEEALIEANGHGSSPEPTASPSKVKRRLRVQTPSSEVEPEQPVASGSGAESALTELDGSEEQINEGAAQDADEPQAGPSDMPSTPRRRALSATHSFIHSPVSEKRRRLEELADARLEKEKRRRFG